MMVEFSHPNTHSKLFTWGTCDPAILGDVVARLLQAAGYDVVRANYPGDIGLHVIKWLWNYLTRHAGERPTRDITQWMGSIYIEASRRLEENPELESEIRAVYTRWDQRDPEIIRLWQETRQWSLDGFKEMYDMLGISFDVYYFNSMMEDAGKEVVRELISRNLAQDERPDGPVIVKLDELLGSKSEKYRVLVVLRSDGTALYATEDLALAERKFRDYPDLERSLYVVDVRQSLHFQQVFRPTNCRSSMGKPVPAHSLRTCDPAGECGDGIREGTVVLLEDLIREATSRAAIVK